MGLSLTLLVLSSCSGKKEYIISERKMAPVLVDIHIADEISTSGYSLDPDIVLHANAFHKNWINIPYVAIAI